jgi:hypothetical protein
MLSASPDVAKTFLATQVPWNERGQRRFKGIRLPHALHKRAASIARIKVMYRRVSRASRLPRRENRSKTL